MATTSFPMLFPSKRIDDIRCRSLHRGCTPWHYLLSRIHLELETSRGVIGSLSEWFKPTASCETRARYSATTPNSVTTVCAPRTHSRCYCHWEWISRIVCGSQNFGSRGGVLLLSKKSIRWVEIPTRPALGSMHVVFQKTPSTMIL